MSFKETEIGLIPKDWNVIELGEIVDVISGYAFKRKDFIDRGIPVVKIKNITSPNISLEDVQYVSKELFNEKEKYQLKYDDILISMTGSNYNQIASAVGKVGRIRIKNTPMLLNQRVGKIVPDENLCDKLFVYYNISTIETRYRLALTASGSANQANISAKQIKKLKIPYPPLEEQKAIAHILSTLDEKIEVSNRINKILEEMAQAIFKHWFIDFEFPNENGEPYKSSGGEMVESELGMIPKGWEVKSLGEVGEIVGGGTPSTKKEEFYGGDIPWITPKDLSGYNRKFIAKGERNITELGLKNSSAKLLPTNTVLFSSRAPIGYVAIAGQEVSTNQGFKSIICNTKLVSANYIYYFLKKNKQVINNIASGSTFKEISAKQMKQIKLIQPNEIILEEFETVLKSIDNILLKNYKEMDLLTNIRDTLLSKLMSGEIRVPLDN